MKLAFIVDPLEGIKAYKDSSVAMMRCAAKRGHEIWTIQRAALTWRDGSFAATQSGGGLRQSFHLEDRGAAWLGLRGRVAWREASLDLDWLVNPDLAFGGNFDGWAQDVEVMARYRFPDQDVTVLAGYRWSELDASGTADGLRFDSEFSVTAIVLGIEFDF